MLEIILEYSQKTMAQQPQRSPSVKFDWLIKELQNVLYMSSLYCFSHGAYSTGKIIFCDHLAGKIAIFLIVLIQEPFHDMSTTT
jgi:hypothetical protein